MKKVELCAAQVFLSMYFCGCVYVCVGLCVYVCVYVCECLWGKQGLVVYGWVGEIFIGWFLCIKGHRGSSWVQICKLGISCATTCTKLVTTESQ